jgi:hypothetical protein
MKIVEFTNADNNRSLYLNAEKIISFVENDGNGTTILTVDKIEYRVEQTTQEVLFILG